MSAGRRPLKSSHRIANTLLFASVAACLLDAVFVVYHYDIVGDRRSSSWIAALVYHAAPTSVGSCLLLAFGLRPATRVRVVSGLVVLGGVALAAELYLQTRPRPVRPPRWTSLDTADAEERAAVSRIASASGASFDMRSATDVIADLQGRGVDAMSLLTVPRGTDAQPSLAPGSLVPIATVSDRTIVLCNESGQWIVNRSDEHGFNNPRGLWSRRVDAVALGESMTHGYCVPERRTYVALIRQSLPATVNLGWSGGPMHASIVLREYAAALRPPVVLWFHLEAVDLDDLWAGRRDPVYALYMRDAGFTQHLVRRQAEIDRRLVQDAGEIERGAPYRRGRRAFDRGRVEQTLTLGALRGALGLVYGETTTDVLARENVDRFADILADVNARVAGWGGTLYFVYQPFWDRFARDRGRGDDERAKVLGLVRTMGIPIIDTVSDFEAHHDPMSLFALHGEFGHYNEAGHRVVADAVLRVLSDTRVARARQTPVAERRRDTLQRL